MPNIFTCAWENIIETCCTETELRMLKTFTVSKTKTIPAKNIRMLLVLLTYQCIKNALRQI